MQKLYGILSSLAILFNYGFLVLSEVPPRPRGVSISKLGLYAPADTFVCLDGSKTILYTQINDDFCDCADSSDEPGTAACPGGGFHCTNAGHRPKFLPSSRVNDGICDCCDASDEYNSARSTCRNVCSELGREERELERQRMEVAKKGNLLKSELTAKGKALKTERNIKIVHLEKQQKEAEAIRNEKEKLKKEAEDRENESLEFYREIQENEKREQQEKETASNRQEAIDTFTKFDSNQDGFISLDEIQTRIEFDKNRDGTVDEEEAKFFLNEHDQIDMEEFITLAWPRVKPYLMLSSGLFKPPGENDEDGDDVDEGGTEHDGTEETADLTDSGDEAESDDHGQDDDDHEEYNNEGEAAEGETNTSTQEYDPDTQLVIESASKARNEFSEADREVREIESELRELRELYTKDYGVDEEFAPLDGECYSYEDREYIYKLCPFDKASQQQKSGGAETRLGTWDRWSGPDSNKFLQMRYSNGASCWNGPQRSAVVSLQCGLEHRVTAVTEPNRCEYHFAFETPASCHLESGSTEIHDEL